MRIFRGKDDALFQKPICFIRAKCILRLDYRAFSPGEDVHGYVILGAAG